MDNATKKVRFITRKWAPAVGGMETYCLRLAEELSRIHDLEVISLPGKANGDAPSPLSLIIFGLKTACQLLFLPRTDVVHLGDVAIWPLGWIAKLRRPDSQIVLSAHGSDLNYANGRGILPTLYRKYVRLGSHFLNGAKLVANSNWIGEAARNLGFSDVTVVALGTELRAQAIPESNNGELLFAGRISPGKGLSFLVDRVLPLLDDPPKIRVAGTIWDQNEAKVLESPMVDYLGQLDAEQLVEEYGNALMVVVPSLTKEGFGLVAVEAAACGGVVIASNHSGLAEVVSIDTGLLADHTDPSEWAQKIQDVCSWSPAKRKEFVTRAMEVSQDRFSWQRTASQTAKVYTER